MFPKNKTALSSLVVLVFGVILFYIGTDGFQAFTAETARVNQLMDEKPKFPDVTLEDNNGKTYSFTEFEGKYVFITFLYTSCGTVCPELEVNMSEVYKRIPEKYIGQDIQFLSISFDPKRDTPKTLETYRKAFGSDGETWRMARIPKQMELESLLDRFGVIVIPDEYGNFAHNSAFYLVNPKGQLVEVMDYTLIEEAAERITEILESGGEE
ncbi:protein SCO1/2 [Cytobacillus firmus]|uniref:Protein SCO1/2 n=2 Tax=Cytobacillus TaxID=2675230 RepID=A0A366JQ40_CYTFI|nr:MULTISPECIES: SCO family protein [Cytobacillus]RBP90134.1 protein SCO1/2 [Cytobacillus firmus]TDX40582.1 protein SCO1/2 [Cytobacillus oceanisediminis]